MAEGSIMELSVLIKAVDYFSGPLRSMIGQVTAAEGKMKSISNTMKLMGKSAAEIDAVNASLQKMADQKAFANVANDLQSIGMARQDIAAMEQSYMRMAQHQRDMAKAQEKYAAGKDLAMSGVGSLTTAAVGGFGIYEMVKQAGEFQSNMATIQDSTGATNKQMQDFGNAIMSASQQVSKFNDFQMAQIGQTLTSGGFSNVKQAQDLLLPTAKFAEVQAYENKASDPIESTKQAIEMAHIFKNYDPKSFGNFLNTFNKYSMMQPGASSALEQTITYLAPTAQTLGMKPSDIMALAALDNRIGLTGSHGGTNSADMILRMIPGLTGGGPTPIKNSKGKITGYKTPQAWAAMQDLGLIDSKGNSKFFNKNGSIKDLHGLITDLISQSKGKNPAELMKDYNKIFGIQGGRAAAILSDPKVLEQLNGMDKQLGKTKNIDKIHDDHMNTAAGQLNLFKSNGMTLMLRVAQQLATALNPSLKSVNKLLDSLGKFSQAHPGVNKIIGDFILLAVGGKAAEGVFKIFAGNIKMVSAAFDMLKLTSKAGELTKLGRAIESFKGIFSSVSMGVRLFASSFGKGVQSIVDGIGGMTVKLVDWGATFGRWVGNAVAGFGRMIAKGAVWAAETAVSFGKVAASAAVSFGKMIAEGAIWAAETAVSFGKAAASAIASFAKMIAEGAVWAAETAADWLIAMGPVGWIIMGVTAIILAGIAMWKTNFLGFRDGLKAVWNVVKSDAGAAWNWIKTTAQGVVDWFQNLPGQMMQIGQNMMQGLINGISSMVGSIGSTMQNIGSSVVSTFKNILGIHSPSKVFMEHGKYIVQGLAQGIDQNAYVANQSTNRLANGVVNGFRPNVSNGSVSLAGGSGGGINIHPGAIVIQGGNASAQEIAQMVLTKLGQASRTNLMNTGSSLNIASF